MDQHLRSRLAGHLHSDHPDAPLVPTRAAVLVPLFRMDGKLGTLFIHRTEDLGPHSGQMGFPGGMAEPGDNDDLLRTALRESGEEIGIDPREVEVLGRLSELVTWTSETVVRPYVGWLPSVAKLRPEPREVQGIHLAALEDLAASRREDGESFGVMGTVFPVNGLPVWGLTARILKELFAALGWRQAPISGRENRE